MIVAIPVHSRTGNTRSVAERLTQTLESSGHTVRIIDVKATDGSVQKPGDMSFDGVTDLSGYDGIIFGSPVHAFSLAPDMEAFMKMLPPLKGKTVACFVTQAFPFPWMGGTRAVGQMAKLCRARGATVSATGVVNWGRTCREQLIRRAVERITSFFG
ncbi:MAG: flavodoxin domain-containing protein [Candidatus Fermentibacteraceae bacterium]